MDNQELQSWVERVSIECFGLPFRHRAVFNPRLRTTGGRYFPKTHHIEISSGQLEVYGPEETEAIIKHELCHYHLHLQGKGYKHRDADFKALLAQVGGSRHCRPLPGAARTLPVRYLLVCRDCGQTYPRKRKTDPRKYVCGRCRGRLRLFQAEQKPAEERGG